MSKLGWSYRIGTADLIDRKEYEKLYKSGKLSTEEILYLKQFLKEFYSTSSEEQLIVHPKEMITALNETDNDRRRALHASKQPILNPTTPNNFHHYGDMEDYCRSITHGTPEDALLAKEEYETPTNPAQPIARVKFKRKKKK